MNAFSNRRRTNERNTNCISLWSLSTATTTTTTTMMGCSWKCLWNGNWQPDSICSHHETDNLHKCEARKGVTEFHWWLWVDCATAEPIRIRKTNYDKSINCALHAPSRDDRCCRPFLPASLIQNMKQPMFCNWSALIAQQLKRKTGSVTTMSQGGGRCAPSSHFVLNFFLSFPLITTFIRHLNTFSFIFDKYLRDMRRLDWTKWISKHDGAAQSVAHDNHNAIRCEIPTKNEFRRYVNATNSISKFDAQETPAAIDD